MIVGLFKLLEYWKEDPKEFNVIFGLVVDNRYFVLQVCDILRLDASVK